MEKIKKVLFSIGDERAPRPDGYGAKFNKTTWSVIG